MGDRNEARRFNGIKPVGQLGEMLKGYQAPEGVKSAITRRAGGIIGHGLPHSFVERTIKESMISGVPRWDDVTQRVGDAVRAVYRGRR